MAKRRESIFAFIYNEKKACLGSENIQGKSIETAYDSLLDVKP